jgi:putative copper resistance protein D
MLLLVLGRWAHIGSASLLVSVLIFQRLYVIPAVRSDSQEILATGREVSWENMVWPLWGVGFVSWILWFLAVSVSMTESQPNMADLAEIICSTQFGHVWLFRIALSLLLGGVLLYSSSHKRVRRDWRPLCSGLAAINLGTLAWAGHASAIGGSLAPFHLLIDLIHLLVSAVWPGSLFPLAVWWFANMKTRLHDLSSCAVLHRFSFVSLPSVVVLGATGIFNSAFMIGGLSDLISTSYGQILTIKIVIFLFLIGIGAWNRLLLGFGMNSALNSGSNASAARLFRNVCLECTLTLAVFGLVGALGVMAPPPPK